MRRLLFLVVLVAGCPPALAGDTGRRVSVIAHRGAVEEAPENSLPGIDAAVRMGCDMVEVDIRLSKDGTPVLMHDSTVDRTTNGRGRVDQLSWARLRELDAGAGFSQSFSGTRIPSLAEAIDLVRGRAALYLDLKVTDFEPVVRVVRQARPSGSVFYRIYRPQDIDRLRRLDASSPVIIDIGQLGLLPGVAEAVLDRHPDAILSLDRGNWTDKLPSLIRRHSSRWFINVLGRQVSASDLRRAIDLHPTGIMTDRPRLALDVLRAGSK